MHSQPRPARTPSFIRFAHASLIAAALTVAVRAAAADPPPPFILAFPTSLSSPSGIADDAAGNVYIVDTGNNRVLKFSNLGSLLASWGTPGAGNGQFNQPWGIAVDGANVYVGDSGNNRVQKFTQAGGFVSAWAMTGAHAVAIDGPGNIYVTGANAIGKFTALGASITSWGSAGSGTGQFNTPLGVAVDAAGSVYVADTNNGRIQKFTSAGGYLSQWGGLIAPDGIAVDNGGHVIVAETGGYRMDAYTNTGAPISQWGAQGSANGQFQLARAVTTNVSGNILVLDTGNLRLQVFGTVTSTVLTSSVNPTVYGQPITLSATVAAGPLAGPVTFFDGGTPIGSAGLSGSTATLVISDLPAGTRSLTALYAGDANSAASTSGIVLEQVKPAWPHDPVNGNLPICTAAGAQQNVTSVPDGAGGAIFVWQDLRGGSFDIYAQRVNSAGAVQWTANGVALCTASGDQLAPMVVADGAGGAVVVWQDQRGASIDVYAQRVSAAGVPQWAANGVALCTAVNDQTTIVITSDGAGGAIAAWRDSRASTNSDIYAQRVSAAGLPQWTADGVAVCTATDLQAFPTIVTDGAGGAIMAWTDFRGPPAGNNDIYAQRVNAAGVPQWAANGVDVCAVSNSQGSPQAVSDGAGGAIVSWSDFRTGVNHDLYSQRLTAAGALLWNATGVPMRVTTGGAANPQMTSDGAGGAIMTWADNRNGVDYDVFIQRVNATGTPQWTANGMAICSAGGDQGLPAIVSDGAGGAIVTWQDARGAGSDIYGQRVLASGTTLWTANGVAVSLAPNTQDTPTIASDGANGAIVAWEDARSGFYDIDAQRIERFGRLGDPQPTVTSVHDFPLDQGGKVRLGWSRSYLDTIPTLEIGSYGIWRQVSGAYAGRMVARGARVSSGAIHAEDARPGALRLVTSANQTGYWEGIGSVLARGDASYTFVAPTFADSTGASNPMTTFMVDAQSAFVPGFWDSAPDSGYSVDNLPPLPPAPFTGVYVAGSTRLHWGPNAEADLAGYRLYRGGSSAFIPSPATLIGAPPDTGWSDAGSAGSYYKLSATDIHGNESGFTLLTPGSTAAVSGGALPSDLTFGTPWPDPARDHARLSFALPQGASVSLAVYDMAGRLVRTLSSGPLEAGPHQLPFDLRDGDGARLPSGLYFVRLRTGEHDLVRRLAIVQ